MPALVGMIIAAAASLTEEERLGIEAWLFWIQSGLVVLVAALIVFAFALRRIARNSTEPCRWCMEFVPKKASVCPRCGKQKDAQSADNGVPRV